MHPAKVFASLPTFQTLALLGIAFFLRLFFAPTTGPFPKDVEAGLIYELDGAQIGVTELPARFAEKKVPVMYPPLYCYQTAWLGKCGARKLAALQHEYPEVGQAWVRVRHKLLPIAYDMLTGIVLMLVLAKFVPRPWPLLGGASYLLNPCVFIDSALWSHADAIHSFFVLLVILSLGLTLAGRGDRWLIAAWLAFALAMGSKLQSIVIFAPLAAVTLMRRRWTVIISGFAVFALTTAALYTPFLLSRRWDYFQYVFVRSFTEGQFTVISAFNFWGLGFVVPSTTRLLGLVSYAQIGQVFYLGCAAWLFILLVKSSIGQQSGLKESIRTLAVAGAYASIAPFMVLTQMRERYIAPAIPLLVLAACLDRRLRWLFAGFSLTYTLNLLYVQRHVCASPDELAIVNASNFAIRVFGCMLNIGMFAWFTVRLPCLLRGDRGQTATRSETGSASEERPVPAVDGGPSAPLSG